MDLSAVQRCCGGRWTGEQRRTDQMLRITSHILPEKMLLELGAALIDGVPNQLVAEILQEELEEMLKRKNMPNVKSHPELIEKAILKEERNHLSMTFSKLLANYTPNIGIIPLGILIKLYKKIRMYRHGSFRPHKGPDWTTCTYGDYYHTMK